LLIAINGIHENGLHWTILADDLSLFEVHFKTMDTNGLDICGFADIDG